MFENQLNNPKFVERAPAALVEDIRNKHAKSQDKLANIEQSIKALADAENGSRYAKNFSLAHCGTSHLYLCAHCLHRLHLFQLHADR